LNERPMKEMIKREEKDDATRQREGKRGDEER
jgi:hypothetical protein